MSNNAYYLGKAKPLNGKEVIISGTLSDLPYEKDGSFYYVVKADAVNGEKSSLSFRVVSKTPLCIDVTDEVSLSAKAFLLGGDSDEILKYYKSKSLFLGAHSPENISIKRGEKKNIGTMLLLLRQKLTSETLCFCRTHTADLWQGFATVTSRIFPEMSLRRSRQPEFRICLPFRGFT